MEEVAVVIAKSLLASDRGKVRLSRVCKTAPIHLGQKLKSIQSNKAAGLGYSLSPPGLAVSGKAVPRRERELEVLAELRLNKDRGTLVALIRVLVVNSRVVLLGVIAALLECSHQLAELL